MAREPQEPTEHVPVAGDAEELPDEALESVAGGVMYTDPLDIPP